MVCHKVGDTLKGGRLLSNDTNLNAILIIVLGVQKGASKRREGKTNLPKSVSTTKVEG